ncbi:MAG: GNAT family N-acetyltransferase [Proteobacteria bacterium]|nr:GNAT family N-acetyltransferase [Pseudomonadota bacterium]
MLNIRNAVQEDADALATIYNHFVEHTHITFDISPVDRNNRLEWMNQFDTDGRHQLLVGEVDGHVVGYACSSRLRTKAAYDLSVETTIYLQSGRQGHGLGEQLYRELLARLSATDVHRCYGVIALPNDASVHLHQKLGFSSVGQLTEVGYKFGRYWDTLWMEKSLS